MSKSQRDISKEEALKGIARERQLMTDVTVEMVIAMHGNDQAALYKA